MRLLPCRNLNSASRYDLRRASQLSARFRRTVVNAARFIRLIAVMGGVTIAALVGVWIFVDRPAAEKAATALAQPCGLIWYMLIAATIIAWRHAERGAAIWTTFTLLVYTTAGNGFVSEAIFRSLESRYYGTRPLGEEPFDAIVLLGGGASGSPAGRAQGNQSGDRVILAAEMYHAGLTPKIICCGNRIPSVDSSSSSPGERSIAVLKRLDVPGSALQKTDGINTAQELQAIRKLFPDSSSRLGLVTSAWHMPRVMKLADRLNIELQPLPADFRTGAPRPKAPGEVVLCWIPSSQSLDTISIAFREYLGMIVGR